MKIFLFSPYFPDHFGGGEKYLLDVARSIAEDPKKQAHLAISCSNNLSLKRLEQIKKEYENFFDYDLSNIKFISTPLGTKAGFFKKLFWTKNFDLGYYLTDGSLFFSLARKNILHIQVPLRLDKSSFIDRKKLNNWKIITTNSHFTKNIVEPSWGINVTTAHQPMVEVQELINKSNLQKKEKIILNVGRFFSQLHSKRQDIMVVIFKRLIEQYKKDMEGWQLVLVGGVEDKQFAERVTKMSEGLPIKIIHNASRDQVLDWYQRSSIYWHATGYRVHEEKEPEKVEHFGISTVEAMAAGNVPLVIPKGGQKEVLGDELCDWGWLTQRECIKKTRQMVTHPELRLQIQKKAQKQSLNFGPKVFKQKLKQLIDY
jgi:glycosyltransferase involved in cell wall biosynthesis